MSEIFGILELFFTSWPFPVALLLLIIGAFLFWYFKIKPERDAKQEAKDEAFREQGENFLKAMIQCKENFQHTVGMYEKALENSTKAIENSTAAMNMMSMEMKHLNKQYEHSEKSLDRIEAETKRGNENMAKALVILGDRD